MLGIGSFFERWRNKDLDEIMFRGAIIDVVKDVLSFEIDQSAISYSNGIIFLKISPAAKGAIYLKKTEVIKKIQEKIKNKIVDIR